MISAILTITSQDVTACFLLLFILFVSHEIMLMAAVW